LKANDLSSSESLTQSPARSHNEVGNSKFVVTISENHFRGSGERVEGAGGFKQLSLNFD